MKTFSLDALSKIYHDTMNKKILLVSTATVIILAGSIGGVPIKRKLVMHEFYNQREPEVLLMDPLILNRELVRAHVTQEIRSPEMPRRLYAIGFLGHEKIREAIPNLQAIVNSPLEKDAFRAAALRAIWSIEPTTGVRIANDHKNKTTLLGQAASDILAGIFRPIYRSKSQIEAKSE